MLTLKWMFALTMAENHSELEGLRRLDSQAVAAIYDRYYPDVFRYLRYRLANETLAEDLASEVFLQMLEAVRKRGGPETNLRAWLLGIANHLVTDHLRRRYRRPEEFLSETMADRGPTLTEEVEQHEHQQLVQSALMQLTLEQQHILALRFGQGCSLEETAVIMKKNINAVKAMQFRALAALQREIGGQHE